MGALDKRTQLICTWLGYAFVPIYTVGFIFAGFFPIPSPNLDAAQVAANFDQNQTRILVGNAICIIASALLAAWSVAIFTQMSRIDARSRTLSYLQLVSGALGVVFFIFPSIIWSAMAFRSGHNPDTLLILYDIAWLIWVLTWPSFALQGVAIGMCTLFASEGQAVLPRWAGYASLWLGVCTPPACLAVFFKTGPFAWDGIFPIYLPLVIFLIWYHCMFIALLKAVKEQPQSSAELRAELTITNCSDIR